ncbi:hypothetical protein [Microbulbifer variabilis]|uniref:hypothetical protein n=1 Tax=Microbulbifer variabilis TaxID=266805 RepID=UPI001CFD73A2|nr:hypothetical protein [Microbulbifer variabilis]
MTEEQMEAWEKLGSIPERAKFLLDIGVTAEVDIEESDLMFRACVGEVRLPVTGASKLTAIERGTTWLKDKLKEAKEGE